jgi:hypothetical protein
MSSDARWNFSKPCGGRSGGPRRWSLAGSATCPEPRPDTASYGSRQMGARPQPARRTCTTCSFRDHVAHGYRCSGGNDLDFQVAHTEIETRPDGRRVHHTMWQINADKPRLLPPNVLHELPLPVKLEAPEAPGTQKKRRRSVGTRAAQRRSRDKAAREAINFPKRQRQQMAVYLAWEARQGESRDSAVEVE